MKYLKFTAILFAACVLAMGGLKLFGRDAGETEECRNLLSSGIYSEYLAQLMAFLREHPLYQEVKNAADTKFNTKLKSLLSALENPSDPRAVHESFVNRIRELAELVPNKSSAEEKAGKHLFGDLINWIFRGPDLNEAIQEYIYSYIEPPSNGDLLSYLEANENLLYEDPRFDGLQRESPVEDNFLHGNLPSVYFEDSVKVVRMGRPTSQRRGFPWLPPKITPEFFYFIKQHPGHLYINLAKRHGQEWRATKRIEALEKEYSGFYVVTLDKNSDFYLQEKAYVSQDNSSQFKILFLEKMLDRKGDFYWSKYFNEEKWALELEELVDGVHKKYFSEKTSLNQDERKDFIELTYLAILNRVVEKCHPVSLNLTCNQGMDRSPSLLVLWMIEKKANSSREIAALLFGPPLFLHNRSSHPSRITRFISAAKRLMQG